MGFSSFKSYGSKVAIPNLAKAVVVANSTVEKTKYIKSFTQTGSNTFVIPADVEAIEILLIAGGGGGGNDTGGGGGGGGFVYIQNLAVVSNTTYTINVGVGGLADINTDKAPNGGNGGDSTFGNLAISHGGGGGGDARVNVALLKGGSTGGGSAVPGHTSETPAEPFVGEGNKGGFGSRDSATTYGGGGGGAGQVGQSAISTGNAKGGDGLQSNITGTLIYYSGGGGGGTYTSSPAQSGGLGGGGFGSNNEASSAIANGAINSGGGGGGGGNQGARTGAGGSGIVIITYLSSLITAYQQLLIDKKPWGRYSAEYFSENTLTELGGITSRNATTSGILASGKKSGNGANQPIHYLTGNTNSIINFTYGSIPQNFTICSITRYTGPNRKRILEGDLPCNFLHGHHGEKRGVISYDKLIFFTSVGIIDDWLNCCGTNNPSIGAPNNILIDGVAKGNSNGGGCNTDTTMGINTSDGYKEFSDFEFSQLIIFDQFLTSSEMIIVSNAFNNYLQNGVLDTP